MRNNGLKSADGLRIIYVACMTLKFNAKPHILLNFGPKLANKAAAAGTSCI